MAGDVRRDTAVICTVKTGNLACGVGGDCAGRALGKLLFKGFYLLTGLVILVRGGPWVEAAGRFLSRRDTAQTEVWRFLISVGRLVLPVAALFALSIGLSDLGLFGRRSALLLESLPLWAITFVSFRWVSSQLLLAD